MKIVHHMRFELRKFLRACKHGKACGFSRQSSFNPRFERPFAIFSSAGSVVVSGVGSKAADVKNRKRPMLKQPMLLKAADVA